MHFRNWDNLKTRKKSYKELNAIYQMSGPSYPKQSIPKESFSAVRSMLDWLALPNYRRLWHSLQNPLKRSLFKAKSIIKRPIFTPLINFHKWKLIDQPHQYLGFFCSHTDNYVHFVWSVWAWKYWQRIDFDCGWKTNKEKSFIKYNILCIYSKEARLQHIIDLEPRCL